MVARQNFETRRLIAVVSDLRKWYRLNPSDRALLLRAYLLTWAVRIALWTLPFRALRQWLLSEDETDGAAAAAPYGGEAEVVERVTWAVRAAARRVPSATCLSQALVARRLLRHRGCPTRLCIGVTRAREGEAFRSHAWLESGGNVLLGDLQDLNRYVPIPSQGGASALSRK